MTAPNPNHERLSSLLRMLGEVERLEAARSDGTAASVLYDGSIAVRRWSLVVAATAACVVLLIPTTPERQRGATHALASALRVHYAPCRGPGPRVDQLQSVAREPGYVLALLREWHSDCECLAWNVYRWDDGGAIARVDRGDPIEIALDVSDDPPIEQMLLLAVSPRRDRLPGAEADSDAIIACLNNSVPTPNERRDAGGLALAVQSCLPEGTTVVPHTFVVK